MRREKGLTLIELAIVLIVLGILLGIGAGIIGVLIKRVKYNESKEIVNAAVEGIIGYVINSGRLPNSENALRSTVRSVRDSYGKPLLYIYSSNLDDSSTAICNASSTNLVLRVGCSNENCTSYEQEINNVAFIVVSGDGNYNIQTGVVSGTALLTVSSTNVYIRRTSDNLTDTTTVGVYTYGFNSANNDKFTDDLSRAEPYDDIVKWVSLNELKPKAGCVGSGGGGGGGGSCSFGSSITVNNTGGNRTVRLGTIFFFFCSLGSCQNFSSISVSSSSCFRVYTGNNCNNSEGTFNYNDVFSADTNRDCVVNYNNGSLVDN